MDGNALWGAARLLGVAVTPVLILTVAFNVRPVLARMTLLGRRLQLLPEPPELPQVRPIEHLATILRRLRPDVRAPRPELAPGRQRGILAAYDGALVEAAVALGVPTTLRDLPDGLDQELERLRLEDALAAAGLDWHEQHKQ